MFKRIILFCTAVIIMLTGSFSVNSAETEVSAVSAVLYCADSGEVLYKKNADEKRAIASITKIMTAVVALEYAGADDKEVKFTYDMIAEGSSMYLQVGEILKLSELVKGMMMVSGNDAANAIAVAVGGNKEKFAELMNEKAKQIGMNNTHFVTPSGLDDEQHYSTAYDMALLCAYAMENEQFRDIVSQKSINVSFVYPENKKQLYVNHNKLLSMYDDCIGIKTGFTKKAGRTLTSCAQRDGVRLIAVTLNDGDDWNDHIKMFDYGFSKTERVQLTNRSKSFELPVVGSQKESVRVIPENNCEVSVMKDSADKAEQKIYMPKFIYAPVKKGTTAGKLKFFLNGKVIAETNLITDQEAEFSD